MRNATVVFGEWAENGKDEGMEKGHASSVNEILKFALKERNLINKNFNFLDLGCGNGWVVRKLINEPLCNIAHGVDGAKQMISNAKKRGVKVKCNTFAIKRKIVWNNVNRKVPKNVSVKEFINKLGPNSGITISNAKPPSDLDSEQKKQLKSLLDAGIMTKKEYEEALKQIK